MEQYEKVDEEQKLIAKENLKDASKHFNNEHDHYANKNLIGHKHLLRGMIEKDSAISDCDSMNFYPRN